MDQHQLLPLARSRELERVPDATLHAVARVDARLERDFVRAPFLQETARPGVEAFGVLADDNEVEVLVLRRAQVDVLVELEPQPEDQPALEDPGRDVVTGIASPDRSLVDGVDLPQLLKLAVG